MGFGGGLIAVNVVVEQLEGVIERQPRAGQGGLEQFERLTECQLRLFGTKLQAKRGDKQLARPDSYGDANWSRHGLHNPPCRLLP